MTDYKPTKLVAVQCNARGKPMGTSHHACRYSDEVVAKARAMREQGLSYKQIAAALGVPRRMTIWSWCNGRRRNNPVRVIMRRIPEESTIEQ